MKTYAQKPAEVTRTWYEIDASGLPLGRVASFAAQRIIGKHKATFTPHVDGGDYVIITNADKVVLTGNKEQESKYRYSGYPGGIKSETKAKQLADKPEVLVADAVAGMIPHNKLAKARMKRLHVVSGPDHNHQAQKPQKVEV